MAVVAASGSGKTGSGKTGSGKTGSGKTGARKVITPVAAVVGVVGTMASVWWFALKPRRKHKD